MALDLGRIGIWTPSPRWHAAGDELGDAAAELERLGYGTLWLGAARGDLALPEAVLRATGRLRVATGIVNVWTEAAATVAASYRRIGEPERLVIGLGSSHAPLVESKGIPYRKPLTRLAGYLDELDALDQTIPPERRVLAALGPRALELAARRTAGAHPYLTTPEHTRTARAIVGPDALLAPEQMVILEPDPDRARAIGRATLGMYLTLPNYTNNLQRLGFAAADFTDGGSDRLIDAVMAWGDADTVAARVAEHHTAGADHVCLQVLNSTTPTHTDPLPRDEWRVLAGALRAASIA